MQEVKEIIKNKYECSVDQELAQTAAYVPGRHFLCTQQMAALFCVK